MRMRRSRKRGGKDPSVHVLFSSQWVDLGNAELSGLLGWASELLDSSWVCPLPQRTEKRGMSEDSKDVGSGLIPTVKRFLQLGTERRTDGGRTGLRFALDYVLWPSTPLSDPEHRHWQLKIRRGRGADKSTVLCLNRGFHVRAACVLCRAIT